MLIDQVEQLKAYNDIRFGDIEKTKAFRQEFYNNNRSYMENNGIKDYDSEKFTSNDQRIQYLERQDLAKQAEVAMIEAIYGMNKIEIKENIRDLKMEPIASFLNSIPFHLEEQIWANIGDLREVLLEGINNNAQLHDDILNCKNIHNIKNLTKHFENLEFREYLDEQIINHITELNRKNPESFKNPDHFLELCKAEPGLIKEDIFMKNYYNVANPDNKLPTEPIDFYKILREFKQNIREEVKSANILDATNDIILEKQQIHQK